MAIADATPQLGAVPFQEAIDYLRGKLRLTSRAWTDVWQEQNAVAFTVAGAQTAALVSDFHAALTERMERGQTLADFRKDFDEIVAKHGWSYKGTRGWRTRVIFETNLRTAYQAGRWQQAWALRQDRPYLRYVAVLDNRTRPLHRQWHGTVLPITSEWWATHYPPNGWGCRCTAQSLSERDLARRGFKVSPEPLGGGLQRRVETPDGFAMVTVPPGINPGWAYNVGQASQSARLAQEAARDIGKMPADLGAVVGEAIATATRRALAEDYRTWLAERIPNATRPDGSWRAIGALSPGTIASLAEMGKAPTSAGVIVTAEQVGHIVRDYKAAEGVMIETADLLRLPEIVDRPDAVLIERATGVVLLLYTPTSDPRRGKLVLTLDMRRQLRMRDGRREKATFNGVKTVTLMDPQALNDPSAYQLVEGEL